MAEDAEVGSGKSSTTKSVENLPLDMIEDKLRLVTMMMVVIIKRSKNHPPRSQTDLQGILPPYTSEKGEFPLIVLAIVETLS